MSIALSAHPSAAWPLTVGGHAIRIRALTSAEMLEVQEVAAMPAPLYGQTVYARLRLDHAQRGMDLLALVRDAWGEPRACLFSGVGGWVVLGERTEPDVWYATEAEALVAALEAAPC